MRSAGIQRAWVLHDAGTARRTRGRARIAEARPGEVTAVGSPTWLRRGQDRRVAISQRRWGREGDGAWRGARLVSRDLLRVASSVGRLRRTTALRGCVCMRCAPALGLANAGLSSAAESDYHAPVWTRTDGIKARSATAPTPCWTASSTSWPPCRSGSLPGNATPGCCGLVAHADTHASRGLVQTKIGNCPWHGPSAPSHFSSKTSNPASLRHSRQTESPNSPMGSWSCSILVLPRSRMR